MATRLPTGALREHNSNVAGEILRTPWPAKGYLRWGEILASGGRTSGYGHIGSPGRGLLAGRHSRTRSDAAGSLSRGKRMSTWSALYTIKRTRWTQLNRAVRRIRGILMATPLPWLPVPPRCSTEIRESIDESSVKSHQLRNYPSYRGPLRVRRSTLNQVKPRLRLATSWYY